MWEGPQCPDHRAKTAVSGRQGPSHILCADAQHLPAFIIAARRTSCVRCDGAPALGTFIELRGLPAVRRFARAQAHLRSFTFGNSHKKGSRKAGNWEKTNSGRSHPEPSRGTPRKVVRRATGFLDSACAPLGMMSYT